MTVGELRALGWVRDGEVWRNNNLTLYKIGDAYYLTNDGREFYTGHLDLEKLKGIMAWALKRP